MEDHTGCKDFKMNRNESMSIEVKKEAGANISLNQVTLTFEDETSFHLFSKGKNIFTLFSHGLSKCANVIAFDIFKVIATVFVTFN